MALLKYLKNNISFNDLQKTHRIGEPGKMFKNYLFSHSTIKIMNLEKD